MADPTTQQAQANDEAQALAAAQAGYNRKARGETPPADLSPAATTATPPLADSVQVPPENTPPEPDLEAAATPAPPAKPDPIAAVTDQLSALRSQVQDLAKGDGAAAEVRKLHGEIGNINRTLKQLQTAKAADAPASEDKLAAVMKRAEKVAEEFPEIAGPLVEALKEFRAEAAKAKPPQEPDPAPEPAPQPAATTPAQPAAPALDAEQVRAQARQQAAIDAINELHPDRLEINKTPEWKTWLASKSSEYQKTLAATWNPAVLSKAYDEFKASRKARQSRQERLDAAIQPQGTETPGGPSTIPDDQAARLGYEKARAKRHY